MDQLRMIALDHSQARELDVFVEYKPFRIHRYIFWRIPVIRQLDSYFFFFRLERTVSKMLADQKNDKLIVTKSVLHYTRINLRLSNYMPNMVGKPLSFLISKRLEKNIDNAYELERLVRKSFFSNPENRGPKDPLAEAVAYSSKKSLESHYAKLQKG
jgi:hypothetical protein